MFAQFPGGTGTPEHHQHRSHLYPPSKVFVAFSFFFFTSNIIIISERHQAVQLTSHLNQILSSTNIDDDIDQRCFGQHFRLPDTPCQCSPCDPKHCWYSSIELVHPLPCFVVVACIIRRPHLALTVFKCVCAVIAVLITTASNFTPTPPLRKYALKQTNIHTSTHKSAHSIVSLCCSFSSSFLSLPH